MAAVRENGRNSAKALVYLTLASRKGFATRIDVIIIIYLSIINTLSLGRYSKTENVNVYISGN